MRTEQAVRQKASALVITLALLVLVTILVVGFLARTQLDVISSQSHLEGVEAQTYAQMATDMAAAKICTIMGGSNHFWATGPGRIYSSRSGAVESIDLSSGGAPTNVSDNEGVDINPRGFSSNSPPPRVVIPDGTDMCLRWIYLRQDGSMDTNSPPSTDSANPVIGRFAYWVDDESAKINMNTAWSRSGNTNGIAHPSMVNLESFLTSVNADAVHDFRATNHYFHGIPEVQAVNTNLDAAVKTNRFSMTCYNAASDLNVFNEPRILLTTQKKYADAMGSTNFLDILTTADSDPGTLASLNSTNLDVTVKKLTEIFRRTNWPMAPGKSFLEKYGGGEMDVLLAINIIDYVRSAESTAAFIEPIRGTASSGSLSLARAPAYGGNILATSGRKPYLCEAGIWVGKVSGTNVPVETWWSIYVPPVIPGGNNSDIAINLNALGMRDPVTGKVYSLGDPSIAITTIGPGINNNPIINGGQYATFRHSFTFASTSRNVLPSGGFTPALKLTNNVPIAIGAVLYPGIESVTSAGPPAHSYQVDDPTVATKQADWGGTNAYAVPPYTSTFTSPWNHHTTLGQKVGTEVPQQDSDSNDMIVNGFYVPAPKGTASNPEGRMLSVGELGFVTTGVNYFQINGGSPSGTPWRTLRLQPQNSTNQLPDWALLDLFSVPVAGDTNNKYIQPDSTRKGGLINVNSGVPTFVDENGKSLITNTLPLQSLFLAATNGLDKARAEMLADNISRHVVSPKGESFGTNFYYLPGQIAEIEGVSDSGEASEEIFRKMIDLATTRGTVFSVYAVGQSLKQDPKGNLRVLGERRQVTLLECPPLNGATKVRTISTHSLAP